MNRSTLTSFFMFAAGAVIGSFVTWKMMDQKYRQMADEEIESMREYFSNKSKKIEHVELEDRDDEEDEPEKYEVTENDIRDYEGVLEKVNYSGYTTVSTKEVEKDMTGPYVITPEEFGELKEYETIELTYYADFVLADNRNNSIEDVDDVIGLDSLDHFGEYEDDSVFVRDDERKIDYQILLDPRKYSDVVNKKPHPTEDE